MSTWVMDQFTLLIGGVLMIAVLLFWRPGRSTPRWATLLPFAYSVLIGLLHNAEILPDRGVG